MKNINQPENLINKSLEAEKERPEMRELYISTPIGRPAVFYIPKSKLSEEARDKIINDIGPRFGGFTEIQAGEGSLGGETKPMQMFVTSFGGESADAKQKKEEALGKIEWIENYLGNFMKENGIAEIYLETGEDAQLLKPSEAKGEIKIENLGRPTIFYLPEDKLSEETLEKVKNFLSSHYPFFQIKKGDGLSDWTGKGEGRNEAMFKAAFAGKEFIPELKNFLAKLSEELNEPGIYLETGEDSFFIRPDNPEGENLGRPAIFYVPKSKMNDERLKSITDFLKNNFNNYKYRHEDAQGNWLDDAGRLYQDQNIMFKTAFTDKAEGRPKIKKLNNYLAELAFTTKEKAIYLETGEDARIIEPNIAKIIMRQKPYLNKTIASLREYDRGTFEHSVRAGNSAFLIAKKMDFSNEEADLFVSSAIAHDIGKIYVDPSLISKPGALSIEEKEKIKEHSRMGFEHIKKHDPAVAEIIVAHHEFQEDSYPRKDSRLKLQTEKLARLISLIDAFDALISKRAYKEAMPIEQFQAELEKKFPQPEEKKAMQILIDNLRKSS